MGVVSSEIDIKTKGEGDIIDITGLTKNAVRKSGLTSGIATLFISGATGALTTIEYESGLLSDLPAILERIAPKKYPYEHEKRWHDGNGHSHIRASLIGPSLTIPFINKTLTLGTWQQIIFIELDVRSRSRKLFVQIIGD